MVEVIPQSSKLSRTMKSLRLILALALACPLVHDRSPRPVGLDPTSFWHPPKRWPTWRTGPERSSWSATLGPFSPRRTRSLGTSRTSGVTSALRSVGFQGGQFVAVGAAGTILTSPDGIAWTSRTSGTTSFLSGVTFGAGKHVVVGDNGTVLTSPDAINWSPQSSGTSAFLQNVAAGGWHVGRDRIRRDDPALGRRDLLEPGDLRHDLVFDRRHVARRQTHRHRPARHGPDVPVWYHLDGAIDGHTRVVARSGHRQWQSARGRRERDDPHLTRWRDVERPIFGNHRRTLQRRVRGRQVHRSRRSRRLAAGGHDHDGRTRSGFSDSPARWRSGPRAGGDLSLLVERVGSTAGTANIDVILGSGSAIAGIDFTDISGTLNFASGQSVASLDVPILDDMDFEGAEIFSATLASPSAGQVIHSPAALTAVISDDDDSDLDGLLDSWEVPALRFRPRPERERGSGRRRERQRPRVHRCHRSERRELGALQPDDAHRRRR